MVIKLNTFILEYATYNMAADALFVQILNNITIKSEHVDTQ